VLYRYSRPQGMQVAHRQIAPGTAGESSQDLARSSLRADCAVRMADGGASALARAKSTRE
jgi:hypothetical protein